MAVEVVQLGGYGLPMTTLYSYYTLLQRTTYYDGVTHSREGKEGYCGKSVSYDLHISRSTSSLSV